MRKEKTRNDQLNENEAVPTFLLQNSLVLHGPVISLILFKNITKIY